MPVETPSVPVDTSQLPEYLTMALVIVAIIVWAVKQLRDKKHNGDRQPTREMILERPTFTQTDDMIEKSAKGTSDKIDSLADNVKELADLQKATEKTFQRFMMTTSESRARMEERLEATQRSVEQFIATQGGKVK